MAHHKSAKKRARQAVRRTAINRARLGRVRTFLRRVEAAIAGGDKNAAMSALRAAEPELARGVAHGMVDRNAAARKLSRLNARIKAL
jgi:small subunit ribosomal protein S20